MHAEAATNAQAMGWAWADENTHKYGGAPCGTVYLGALTGILLALRFHTDPSASPSKPTAIRRSSQSKPHDQDINR